MKKLLGILFSGLLVVNSSQAKNISLSKDLGMGLKTKEYQFVNLSRSKKKIKSYKRSYSSSQ